ncbi:MAG TPA: transcriptional regulator [Allosphingosinicella sp.]|jgi:probable addiction module antidote protein
MGIETRAWDAADHLDSKETILAYLEAAFEDGDPELIAAALNDIARAKGLPHDALTAQSDIGSVMVTLKALGLELTAKAA